MRELFEIGKKVGDWDVRKVGVRGKSGGCGMKGG